MASLDRISLKKTIKTLSQPYCKIVCDMSYPIINSRTENLTKLSQIFRCFDMKRETIPDLWSIYFQTFCPRFLPNFLTWFHSGVSRFNFKFLDLYCYLTNLLFSLTLKILFITSGFSLFIVLYISTHKFLYLFTLIFTFAAFSNKSS